MKILFIHHYAGSPKYGMAYRVYYLAREWVKLGHSVHVHAASFSHIRSFQPELLDNKSITESIDGIEYTWHKTPAYKANGLGRVLNMLSFIWKIFLKSNDISDDFEPDVVIASSTYPMDMWPAHRIAKRSKAKLIFEVHDLWPLSPIELGRMSKWHPFILLMQLAEGYAYKHADRVVSMLPKAKDYMISRGMIADKFHYIPNGVDIDEWEAHSFLPDITQSKINDIKLRNKPVIGYAGTYGLANALDELLDVAKSSLEDFEVVLVGKGPEHDRLVKRIKEENIYNVTLLDAIPKASIPAFLDKIDIAYIGWHRNPLYRFGISPNKLMDYMMAGKPIIHVVEAGNDPVSEVGCGITVIPGDIFAIREAILKLIKLHIKELVTMGERGKHFILTEQTYSVLAQRFLMVMEN